MFSSLSLREYGRLDIRTHEAGVGPSRVREREDVPPADRLFYIKQESRLTGRGPDPPMAPMAKSYRPISMDMEVIEEIYAFRKTLTDRALGDRFAETELGIGSTIKIAMKMVKFMFENERIPQPQEVHDWVLESPRRGRKTQVKLKEVVRKKNLEEKIWRGHLPYFHLFDGKRAEVICYMCAQQLIGGDEPIPGWVYPCKVALGTWRPTKRKPDDPRYAPFTIFPAHPNQITAAISRAATAYGEIPKPTGPGDHFQLNDIRHLLSQKEINDDDNDRDGNSDGHPNPQEAPRGEEGDAEAHPG